MKIKLFPKLFSIAVLVLAGSCGFSQVGPSGRQGSGSLPLVLGGGYSNFTLDWGPRQRSNGLAAWVDVYPLPGRLKDLGIEMEGRSSRWGNPVPNLRQDTAQIGGIYSYSGFKTVHPFATFVAGIGSMDFPPFPGRPNYTHDNFTVTSTAAGGEIHAFEGIWIRGEYEYQWWHKVFGPGNTSTPNGFSVGLQYDLRRANQQ